MPHQVRAGAAINSEPKKCLLLDAMRLCERLPAGRLTFAARATASDLKLSLKKIYGLFPFGRWHKT